MIGWMFIGISCFTAVYVGIGAADLANSLATVVPGGGLPVIIMMQVILIGCGMIMEVLAMIMIFGSIFTAVSTTLGFDPVWFGVLFMINVQAALLSPPYGFGLFFMKSAIASLPEHYDASLWDIIRGSFPFFLVQLGCLAIILIFPNIATFLPELLI